MSIKLKSVLVVDGVSANCAEILSSHNIIVATRFHITREELLKEIHKYDGLVVRSASHVTREVLIAGKKLKVVARAGASVDNIDVTAAKRKGVVVINVPGAPAMSACELTCGLIMALARHIVQAGIDLKDGLWVRGNYTGTELIGKTIAIIGLGRVGREVAIRMNAFGMRIIAYDPKVTKEQCEQVNANKMELDEIWPHADYITLHTPLTDSTRKMINAKVLARCKKGVKIINVGRGGLINDNDLFNGLVLGQVGGAALDVFTLEPPTDCLTQEIIKHPAVIVTPRLGASTKEAQLRVGQEIAEQLVNLVKPGTYSVQPARIV